MSIEKSFEETLNSLSKPRLGEFEDFAQIVGIEEYKSAKTGKTSIKLNFKYNDSDFGSFMGLTAKSLDITTKQIVRILVLAVGVEKAKEIFDKVAADEDTEDDLTFALELKNKLNNKLRSNPVKVWVIRKKEGDFWSVKWYDKKPEKTELEKNNEAVDKAANETADSFAAMLED